jgi:hypothetical protein
MTRTHERCDGPVPHAVGVVIDLRARVVRHALPEGAGRAVAQGQHVDGDATGTLHPLPPPPPTDNDAPPLTSRIAAMR